jgi:hypothetical protein
MRRALILTCLVACVSAVLPAAAAASYPWFNQNAMRSEPDPSLRETFIVDTAAGETISRQLFLSQPYLSFYEGEGFDRNFFTWAPRTSVGDEYVAGRGWTRCGSVQVPVVVGPSYCSPTAVGYGAPGSIREDVLTGFLTGYKWGETFVSDVSGNWSPTDTAPKGSPMPALEGTVYEDLNIDGAREQGEPGIPGWGISLLFNGKEVGSTTTGTGGSYSFQLDADTMPIGSGTYSLKEEPRVGWHQQRAPKPIFISVGAGEAHFGGNDFGNWQAAIISGHAFDDSNVDGIWGESEKGLAEWGLQLSNGEEGSTGGDGSYAFSVRPGTYTVDELLPNGWRQTIPGGLGTREYTVASGQVVEGADFGDVCLGGVAAEPVDDSTGDPLAGLEVRLEEVSVLGILENEPSLPIATTGTPSFGGLLPGTYRLTTFLPEGTFTADPDTALVEGRFAIVKEMTVGECETARLPLHLSTGSTPGKVTGGVKLALAGASGSANFDFATKGGVPRGSLQYQGQGLTLNTSAIEAVSVSGNVASVWGKVDFAGARRRFHLRLLDAGEPGRSDRFELTLAPGYEAGLGETIAAGNVQVHG